MKRSLDTASRQSQSHVQCDMVDEASSGRVCGKLSAMRHLLPCLDISHLPAAGVLGQYKVRKLELHGQVQIVSLVILQAHSMPCGEPSWSLARHKITTLLLYHVITCTSCTAPHTSVQISDLQVSGSVGSAHSKQQIGRRFTSCYFMDQYTLNDAIRTGERIKMLASAASK